MDLSTTKSPGLAYGLRVRITAPVQSRRLEAIEHYRAGLRLLVSSVQDITQPSELDFILAALWLMIYLERLYGDGTGEFFSTHLRGAASVIQEKVKKIPQDRPEDHGLELSSPLDTTTCEDSQNTQSASPCRVKTPERGNIACLSSQIIFWIALAETVQLRYMLSKLASIHESTPENSSEVDADTQSLACAIEDVKLRYKNILEIATSLEIPKDGPQRRFVLSVWNVVSFYYAVVLCFHSITNHSISTAKPVRRSTIRKIIDLAFRAYCDGGDDGMYRIAWLLCVVVTESEDEIHRDWIIKRFEVLGKAGEDFRRAHQALEKAFSVGEGRSRSYVPRVGYFEVLRQSANAPFVI
ncbi:hypothetical protein BO71DRAFT_455010 [Aspergillus ellipticus CBS 707.79]|uniref:Zn(II)2Cys6 transcription factor n=1 Tax=Aspergillus ellipticus CBS 707.79 TaxID=1448320 RepID=A0A319F4Y6_9EURO|nr:hypothetical protein BO71DRAFT_455010 [Aspergillus ellipticus CBS 707.79]